MQHKFSLYLLLFAAVGTCAIATSAEKQPNIKVSASESSILFSPGQIGVSKFYNYCPSIFEDDDGTRHIYYCTNKVAGNVTDYIGYRTGYRQANGTYTWSEQSLVLSPTSGAWDSRHTCDPSVIKGSFTYNSTAYSYLMAYLGCSSSDGSDNETGLAVSNAPAGPWIKVSGQFRPFTPVDSTGESWEWGNGQPSLVSIDKAGKVLVTYTIGDKSATRIVAEKWNLSNLNNPQQLSNTTRLSVTGLTQSSGAADYVLNNADFAYDPETKRMYMIRDGHPSASVSPTVSTEVQICYTEINPNDTSIGGNLSGSTSWKVLKTIDQTITGNSRNHNAGLVTDSYGHLKNSTAIEAVVAGGYNISSTGTNIVWPELATYRLYGLTVEVPSPENDWNIDAGVHISYASSTNTNICSWWDLNIPESSNDYSQGLPNASHDFSTGNAVAIRFKDYSVNNTTPMRIGFKSNNYQMRVTANGDGSKQVLFLSNDGKVTTSPYRTWDGDVVVNKGFDGWIVLKKADQVAATDNGHTNSGEFSWENITNLYFGIQNYQYYDAAANYDIGDIYTANVSGTNITFVKPVFLSGSVTSSSTNTVYTESSNNTGNVNIVRKNIDMIRVTRFIAKLATVDTCSKSYATGYKTYYSLIDTYNTIKSYPIEISYFRKAKLRDYQSLDADHVNGLTNIITAQEKWDAICVKCIGSTVNANPLLIKELSNNYHIFLIIVGVSLIGLTITFAIRKHKKGYN